ncbi:hypothetical protein QF046_002098 [Microbacterium sp. W4I4]|uniref:hypothetical protein n=1 Tax=Microbacterium sp. W4I4 TaxID=3042295 RepID=UPI002789FD00|nr:hypothetical protein [Microbacterium sp. W4I4]MDQ0614457.1 hypothetical protein [Microbacterium sp. W4I4]
MTEVMEAVDKVDSDDDYGDFERRKHRIRLVAWITIVALIVGGGGASLATLLFP